MAHAFKTIPAKPTFGTIKEELYQSDYINRKKKQAMNCNTGLTNSSCLKHNIYPINKSNLIVGQYAFLDLSDTCVAINQPIPNEIGTCFNTPNVKDCVTCNVPITMNVGTNGKWDSGNSNFYQDVYIDPIGELFGYSQCGELNYTHFSRGLGKAYTIISGDYTLSSNSTYNTIITFTANGHLKINGKIKSPIYVTVVGGGQSGENGYIGGLNIGGQGGQGGQGGEVIFNKEYPYVPNTLISVTVGKGGSGSSLKEGTASSISICQSIINKYIAYGGGHKFNTNGGLGGLGGLGQFNASGVKGNDGSFSNSAYSYGGGGGGGGSGTGGGSGGGAGGDGGEGAGTGTKGARGANNGNAGSNIGLGKSVTDIPSYGGGGGGGGGGGYTEGGSRPGGDGGQGGIGGNGVVIFMFNQ